MEFAPFLEFTNAVVATLFIVSILIGSFFLERLRRNLKRLAPDYYEEIGGNKRLINFFRGDPLYRRIQFSIPNDFPNDPVLIRDAKYVVNVNRLFLGGMFCIFAVIGFVNFIKHY